MSYPAWPDWTDAQWREKTQTPPRTDLYSDNQPRDEGGRWTDGGGVSTVSHADYHARFEAAFTGSPYADFVSHYTEAEMRDQHMVPLTANGGKTGVLIHDHGDGRIEATALYNTSDVKGAGIALLREAVAHHGVNYVECYGPYLPALYATLGFTTTDRYPFDTALAAPTWNYSKFDNPAYHLMRVTKEAQ